MTLATVAALAPFAAAAEERPVEIAFFHPHRPEVAQDEERALFADVNTTRMQQGLRPLVRDTRLSRFALAVANRMAQLHYFGHTDPHGVTFTDRLRSAGYRFRFAAENMAFDQDEAHAHAAFLSSPPHYANIVDPHPRRLGVAVVAAGEGEIFYVEEFAE